jgi:2-polyprenyl-3-methyl-5-hydroxy-6-metoxy-1,4-benzoquinol methylase
MLQATGERLIPALQREQLVYAEHLARYRFAAPLAAGRRVLDVACGEGYGTALLAAAGAREAVGIDIDPAAVAHAAEHHAEASFQQGDIAALDVADASFDLVTCFETIEHVADAARTLDELRRVLAGDGLLVISSPNARESLVDNAFHVHELDPEELLGALGERFATVRAHRQQNWLASAVLDDAALACDDGARALELDTVKVAGVEPGRELYTLSVCAVTGEAPALPARAVLGGVYEAHELAVRVQEAERLLRAWNERAVEAERQLAQARAHAGLMETSLSWRLTRPLRAAKLRTRGARSA